MKKRAARQEGIYSAGRVLTQSALAAIQERPEQVSIDLLHEEIAVMVRMVLNGQIERYNEHLDGFTDALGGFIYRCFVEDDE